MTVRAVFIADGSSDLPLRDHLAGLCTDRGLDISIDAPDPARLGALGRRVEDRLRALLRLDGGFEVAFVHRDAESMVPETRRREVRDGALAAGVHQPVVPVVPVRMTEAWLLLDERAIRDVAGKPSGRTDLGLPKVHESEGLADPKRRLRDALLAASESTGRRRDQAGRRFEQHRRLLLQRLDRNGPVTGLESWKALVNDVSVLCDRLGRR